MALLSQLVLKWIIPQYHKLLLRFSSEGFITREREIISFPALRSRVYAGLKNFQKETKFALKAFIKCTFTFIVLVCHVGFTSLFFTGQFLQPSRTRWFSFPDTLPANIYRSNIFECNIPWNYLGIFAERQIKLERGWPTAAPENNILEWIVSKSWVFLILKLCIFNGGS